MNALVSPPGRTIADLLRRLGDVPPDRVRSEPPPGTATINDLLKPENQRCELVDGTLVEKPVGREEAFLGGWLLTLFNNFIVPRNLGVATGGDGFYELDDGQVRGPDVAFVSWGRMAGRRRSMDPFPRETPDLVVEVLSRSNTRAEMTRKRAEYFRAGVTEVWEIDPRARQTRVYTDETTFRDHAPTDTLTTPILPGFVLPLADVFAQLDRHG